jgi:hypothetical protein
MTNTTPIVGRNAVIEYSAGTAVVIGYAQSCNVDIAQDLIKEFKLGSNQAAILAGGNQSYKVTAARMYIDETYASLVLAGAPVDFIFAPAGTKSGNPKVTVKNVILTAHSTKVDQKGIVSESISGEGNNYLVGTF